MSLRLTEQREPANLRNMLYVEEGPDGDGAAYIIVCGGDEDPNQSGVGETIVLNREQVESLKRYLDKLLTT